MHYLTLAEVYQQLEKTTKRLEKTHIVSELLKEASADELQIIVLLLQGKVFPSYDERKIGVAARSLIKVIALTTGTAAEKVEAAWAKKGDLGLVAEELVGRKKQATLFTKALSIKNVFENIRKLADLEGQGTVDKKIKLVMELLGSAKPVEARYIIRTVLEELRVGAGEGVLRDAIVWAFFNKEIKIHYDPKERDITPENREVYNTYLNLVQQAYNLCNDFGQVAAIAKKQGEKGLEHVSMKVGQPIKVMLFQKAKDIPDAFETVGKPCAFEYKYDGFRLSIHKFDHKIVLYTRRLEDVTSQFPEVVEYIKKFVDGRDFILDAEAIGYNKKTGKYVPFQSISRRIKRKYDIHKLSEEMPVEVNVFDIVEYEGRNHINEPFRVRRALIERIIKQTPKKIVCAKQIITDDLKKAQKFYEESLKEGQEGVMAKNLEGIYKPGSRVGYGVKIKPIMETLDLVIVGAEWGEGKRKGWLSSYVIACRDADSGELLEIGRVATGIKELEQEDGTTLQQMTDLLKPLIVEDRGKEVSVKPKIVIEVNYEEIQRSPTYGSGYALRFPRLMRLREDKGIDDVSTIEDVENLYHEQRGRSS